MSRWLELLVVALAGGAGAGLRYVLERLIGTRGRGGFPLGILVVNITGSFALGLLTGLGTVVVPQLAVVLGTGLLGGYTTFSAVSVDSVLLGLTRRPVRVITGLFLIGPSTPSGRRAGSLHDRPSSADRRSMPHHRAGDGPTL